MLSLLLLSLTAASASHVATSADSALNLLDTTDFFVCDSTVAGINGHYVLSDEIQSDEYTPVFVREDTDTEETIQQNHDYRLFRHNGFWMFADVAAWPPTTHFRCDPMRRDIADVNTVEACGVNLKTPPRVGYTSVDPKASPLTLQERDCTKPFPTPKAEL